MSFKLTDYEAYDFANRRHIGPSPQEMADMLKVIGFRTLDQLIDATVPAEIRQSEPLFLGELPGERVAVDDDIHRALPDLEFSKVVHTDVVPRSGTRLKTLDPTLASVVCCLSSVALQSGDD